MGAKLTRLQDSVNNTRQRVTSSLGKRTSCNAANGAATAERDDGDEECESASRRATIGDGSCDGSGGVYCGNDDDDGGGCGRNSVDVNIHETGHDPAIHGAKLEDRNYNNESFKKRSVDPSDPQQQQAAVTIQTQFRQHSAKEEVKVMREEDAATRIQAGFRGFMDREQVRTMKAKGNQLRRRRRRRRARGDEPAPQQDNAQQEEVDIDLNDPEVEKAAIKIQAGFKGFKARKDVTGQEEETLRPTSSESGPASSPSGKQQEDEEVDIDLNDPEVAQAALKIQAGFGGHQARQEVKDQKVTPDKDSRPTQIPQSPSSAPPTSHDPSVPAKRQQQLQDEEDIAAIDLGDPELKAAALKIQAGFKGIKSRRKVETKKAEKEAEKVKSAEPEPDTETKVKAEEKEIDIDLSDPDVEKAAVKIQAGFKGLKTRKNLQQKTEEATPAAPAEEAAAPAAEQAEQAEAPKEEEIDIDLEDPATEKAALKIQASFRGFQTRKDIEEKKQEAGGEAQTSEEAQPADQAPTESAVDAPATEQQEAEKPAEEEPKKEQEEVVVDIDLEDPEVEQAALKIQAGFKGLKARKELQEKKPGSASSRGDAVDGAAAHEQEGSAEEAPLKVAEGEGQQEEVKASEEETQPKEVVGEASESQQQQEEGVEQTPAAAAEEGAEAEKAPEEDKGEKVKGQAVAAEEEEVDIDLEDPEVEKAALLIQSQFKGFKSKKFGKK